MKKDILTLIAICAFVIVIFLPLFNTPFLYDEIDFLFTWDAIHDVHHIPQLLMGDAPYTHEGVYRPVRALAYVISYQLFHTNLFLYHMQALSIYILCIILVYFITKKLTDTYLLAAMTALIYGLLPLHVDNVANLTASFDTLGVLFAFISFFCFQLLLEKKTQVFLSLTLFFSSLAYFTYEITLCLPLLFFIYIHFHSEKISKRVGASIISIPFFYLIVREGIVHMSNRGDFFSHILEKFAIIIEGAGSYITTSFFPLPPSEPTAQAIQKKLTLATSQNPTLSPFQPDMIVYSLIILLFFVIGVWLYRRRSFIGFGIIWFFLSLMPLVGIAFQNQPLWGRYGVIASFGASLTISTVFSHLVKSTPRRYIARYFQVLGLSCIVCLLGYYAFITPKALMSWKNYIPTLWTELHLLPESAEKHNQLGLIHFVYFEPEKALTEFQKAKKLNPSNTDVRINIIKTCKLAKAIHKDTIPVVRTECQGK